MDRAERRGRVSTGCKGSAKSRGVRAVARGRYPGRRTPAAGRPPPSSGCQAQAPRSASGPERCARWPTRPARRPGSGRGFATLLSAMTVGRDGRLHAPVVRVHAVGGGAGRGAGLASSSPIDSRSATWCHCLAAGHCGCSCSSTAPGVVFRAGGPSRASGRPEAHHGTVSPRRSRNCRPAAPTRASRTSTTAGMLCCGLRGRRGRRAGCGCGQGRRAAWCVRRRHGGWRGCASAG